jgi:IclR family acetate operon transcriptional repressor
MLPETPRPRVQSAARAMAILLAVAQSENGLTAREVSERVEVSRQAAYHLLHTLAGTGVLARDEEHRYVLGLAVASLAEAFGRQLAPAERLAGMVRLLAQRTGETSYAAGWSSGDIATFTLARGTNAVQAAEVPRGYVGNAHARASGKLLLAFASQSIREQYLSSGPLKRLTDRTITTRRSLERALQEIREQGYAVDDEEFATGVSCLAVPLDGGYSPFVLALSAPRDRLAANRDAYLATMREIATAAMQAPSDDHGERV